MAKNKFKNNSITGNYFTSCQGNTFFIELMPEIILVRHSRTIKVTIGASLITHLKEIRFKNNLLKKTSLFQ